VDELINSSNLIKIGVGAVSENKSEQMQPAFLQNIAGVYARWSEFFKNSKVSRNDIFIWRNRSEIARKTRKTAVARLPPPKLG
jgi:hypothetical protein